MPATDTLPVADDTGQSRPQRPTSPRSVVMFELSPDLAHRVLRAVHIHVRGVRLNRIEKLGELAGSDALRARADDVGGCGRS
jgi:hypothetical protein